MVSRIASPTEPRPVRRGGGLSQPTRNAIAAYTFILPTIVGVAVFVAYPVTSSLFHAFTEWNGITPAQWIGLDNFRYLFLEDPTFWPSLRATAYFVLLSVPTGLVGGLALAVLLNRTFAGVRIFRTIFYLPVVLPSIAVLTLWKYIYDPSTALPTRYSRLFTCPPAPGCSAPEWRCRQSC